jgi:hypothetical protein
MGIRLRHLNHRHPGVTSDPNDTVLYPEPEAPNDLASPTPHPSATSGPSQLARNRRMTFFLAGSDGSIGAAWSLARNPNQIQFR